MQIVDDASRFNPTRISQFIKISKENYLDELREVLHRAKKNNVKVSVCGARHTQGGHIAYLDGMLLDLSNLDGIQLITADCVRIQSGATWRRVIEFLHPLGLSADIMQSDDDFSIGGTVSANVHGWQANKPPIVSTIIGFHILTADGTVLYCTRQENSDLFTAAIGGYGLLGIILDVDFTVVKNNIYKLKQSRINIEYFLHYFKNQVQENEKAEMFLGHFSLDKNSFLKNMLFSCI
jgi:FAD/FMN-containing dehydrogenase